MHQEDERIHGVIDQRPFIEIGVTVIKVMDDETFELVDYIPMSRDRQVELQLNLEPGRYIAVPRTTGAMMKNKPKGLIEREPFKFLRSDGESLTHKF